MTVDGSEIDSTGPPIAFPSIVFNPSCNTIFFSLLQFPNVKKDIVCTFFGTVTSLICVFLKAKIPISEIEFGKLISLKLVAWSNA